MAKVKKVRKARLGERDKALPVRKPEFWEDAQPTREAEGWEDEDAQPVRDAEWYERDKALPVRKPEFWEHDEEKVSSKGGGGGASSSFVGSWPGIILIIVVIGFLFHWAGEQTEKIINRIHPAYETTEEKNARAVNEWEQWDQFVTSNAPWLLKASAKNNLPTLPEGKLMFFSHQNGNQGIYLINPDGTDLVSLSNRQGPKIINPAFFPERNKLAFTVIRGEKKRIYIMDFQKGKIVPMPRFLEANPMPQSPEELSESEPSWLHGGLLYFTCQFNPYVSTIWEVVLDDGECIMKIPYPEDYSDKWVKESQKWLHSVKNPVISPDRSKMVFIYGLSGVELGSAFELGEGIRLKNLDTDEEKKIGGFGAYSKGIHLSSQAWAPSNDKIVLQLDRQWTGRYERENWIGIVSFKNKGTWLRISGRNPAWSPDGNWIAFDCQGQIFIYEIKSRTVRRVVGQGWNAENPLWYNK